MPGITVLFTGLQFLTTEAHEYGAWMYVLIFLVILAGSSFVFAPIPGHSLLFVSGALVASGQLDIRVVLVSAVAGAYIGYDLNYWAGRLLGLAVCRRGCPLVFREVHIAKAHDLMKRYGPVAVIVSRFIPAVNLPPFFAGIEAMRYRLYSSMNAAGAVLWCGIVVALGYAIGSISIVQEFIDLLFDLVIVVLIAGILYAAFILIRGLPRRRETQGK